MFTLLKKYINRPFFAWVFIFALFKAFFILFHFKKIHDEAFFHISNVFFQAIRLDISAIAYILISPLILVLILYLTQRNIFKKAIKIYFYVVLLFVSIVNVIDIVLYKYWSSKISLKSFLFLSVPDQLFKVVDLETIFLGLFFVGLHFFLGKFLLDNWVFNKDVHFSKTTYSFIIWFVFYVALLVIGIRGGLQQVPINQSVAYYSKNDVLNVAGVNPLWNFMNVIVQNKKYLNENPYKKLTQDDASILMDSLFYVKKDTTINILNIQKPNIVFIALEGVNANVFKQFGNDLNTTPFLDSLFKTGYLFTQMYANGFRSDQGLVALLSGFPPPPVSSITSQPEKFKQLPSFNKILKSNQYNTSFFVGIEPEFGNFKSYLISNHFDTFYDIHDFPKNEQTQNLGVPDEFLFKKFITKMQKPQEPFFSLIFTSTTHEPYDMPFNENVKDEKQKYLNTVSYIDSLLIQFLDETKKLAWYDNTIFIITSDHAHFHPENYFVDENKRYHIPFFIFGKPLKDEFIGKQNNIIASQVDIPKTILAQLSLANDAFIWSQNLFNPYIKGHAFYTFVGGCVLKTDNCNNGWEYRYDKFTGYQKLDDTTFCTKQSQAYLQLLYQQYLAY